MMNAIVFCTNFWFCRRLSSLFSDENDASLQISCCITSEPLVHWEAYQFSPTTKTELYIQNGRILLPERPNSSWLIPMSPSWPPGILCVRLLRCLLSHMPLQASECWRTTRLFSHYHAFVPLATCQNSRLCKTTPGRGSNNSASDTTYHFKVKIIRIFSSTYVGWPL